MSTTRKVTVYQVTMYEVDVPVEGDGTLQERAAEVITSTVQAPIRKSGDQRRYMWCPFCGGPVVGVQEDTDFSRLVVNLDDHLNRCEDSPVRVDRLHPSKAVVVAGDALEGVVESGYDPDQGDDISGFQCPVCSEIVADAEGQGLHGALSYYLDHVQMCGTEDEA